MPISPELVEILACPKCKGPVEQVAEPEGFGCAECNLFYKVDDDIPNFLIDEATPWKTG
ncbi:MAG: Trm112 family protein [Deltaproteobacteria bacterium]|nr:Trm112 family protein [Deltaproteobacteria bacterium]